MTREIFVGLDRKVALVDDEDFRGVNERKWNYTTAGAITFDRQTRKLILMHRLILNAPQGMKVIHLNDDKMDNRRDNLRLVTAAEVSHHSRKLSQNVTSKFKGVHRSRKRKAARWRSTIAVNGKIIQLGAFDSEQDAARAYNEAAIQHYGEFARLNKVE
ncbi:MAG: hypothetical protein B6D41_12220 [Chloroflexi bacterium UTCFX4]|jgi:hypothetical protein|nr:MAG: hypothetical protein B6D41_12220 [Chloroflexi bacterium UTCFX4]